MDKAAFIAYITLICVPIMAMIPEWNSPNRNMQNIYAYLAVEVLFVFLFLPLVFGSKMRRIISSIPDSFSFLRRILTRIFNFLLTPFMKGIFFTLLLITAILGTTILVKITIGIVLSILYFIELRQKKNIVPWLQGKRPKFQDNFNNGLMDNWDIISGSFFWEKNFGNPAPNLLLKQVGNPSATPQTFSILKKLTITRPSAIECDIYIEPRGIFNLAFGMNKDENSYFMVRLDSRDTEFDALLYKPKNEGWNFISRSDRSRTTFKEWHRVKLEIYSNKKVNFFKDGELILSRGLEKSPYGQIGIMNEEADVHVDNIVITEL